MDTTPPPAASPVTSALQATLANLDGAALLSLMNIFVAQLNAQQQAAMPPPATQPLPPPPAAQPLPPPPTTQPLPPLPQSVIQPQPPPEPMQPEATPPPATPPPPAPAANQPGQPAAYRQPPASPHLSADESASSSSPPASSNQTTSQDSSAESLEDLCEVLELQCKESFDTVYDKNYPPLETDQKQEQPPSKKHKTEIGRAHV